jgi:NitT/TauT family transport system permease protein
MRIILPTILALALVLLWEFLVQTPEQIFLFAKPSSILDSLVSSTANGDLPQHAFVTGAEASTGFILGVSTGTLFGFLLWYSPFVRIAVQPFLFVLGVVPIIAFAPLVLLWFGIGFEMKVALAALATFLISLSQSFNGARELKDSDLKLLKILGASRSQILLKAVIPMSISWVFQSMKLNIGFALLGAFVGEFISADKGIGYFMIRAGSLYDIPGVFAGAVYLVGLALLFNLLIVGLERLRNRIIGVVAISREVRGASL